MPEKEFELYLSLLVKLLRLSPEQKSSIERELRDHFEERFEALVRSGTPRDQAIRRTLDEFGDVAGLANEFTHLSRKHIRRRIMQGTMATAGVAAAIVIYATLFRGPEPAVGPAPNVVAQDKAAGEEAAKTEATLASATPAMTEGDVEWIDPGRFLPQQLAQQSEVQFTNTSLRDVVSYIQELHNVRILLDTPVLNAEGITGDEEVTVDITGAPVHTVLDVILRNVNDVPLAWIQEFEVIRITTKDEADDTETTQRYNVRDLVAAGYARNELLNVVFNLTEGPWESLDGIGGTMAEFGDLLVVKQCERTQRDVACTLAGLRSTHREARIGELEQHARLHAALDQPTEIQFTNTVLRDVIAYLKDIHDTPFDFDWPVLNAEGITGDEEISIDVSGIKLRSALRLMLENVNDVPLDIVIRDGAIWVTTQDESSDTLGTVIYDVSDITSNDAAQMEKLEEVVKGQTDGPWEELDGIGGLLEAPTPGRLGCRQSMRAQDEVRAVLAAIRESLAASGGDRSALAEAATNLETRFYRMDAEAALDVARLIPNLVEPGTWKLYPDSSLMPGVEPNPAEIGTIHHMAAGRMLLRLDNGTVVKTVDKQAQFGGPFRPVAPHPDNAAQGGDAAAESGNSNVVVIPQAVLIITHKPAVLRQVSKLLQTLLSEHGWASRGLSDDKVKFITPGYQEGTWNGSLGGVGGPMPPAMEAGGGVGGFGGGVGGGFGGGGGGFFSVDGAVTP